MQELTRSAPSESSRDIMNVLKHWNDITDIPIACHLSSNHFKHFYLRHIFKLRFKMCRQYVRFHRFYEPLCNSNFIQNDPISLEIHLNVCLWQSDPNKPHLFFCKTVLDLTRVRSTDKLVLQHQQFPSLKRLKKTFYNTLPKLGSIS